MSVSNLENVVSSFLLDQTNYDTVNNKILDASKFKNHLLLKSGTPVWETIAGYEGLLLDNQFYFENEDFPCLPKGSYIYAINTNSDAIDGNLYHSRWFKGISEENDHAATDYDQTMDTFSTTYRDQSLMVYGSEVRIFNGQGANATQSVTDDTWVIVTAVVELSPVKLRQNINGGAFSESVVSTDYRGTTFGNIFRLGQLDDTGVSPSLSKIRMGELHMFLGDVSKQDGYVDFISELKNKYGIA